MKNFYCFLLTLLFLTACGGDVPVYENQTFHKFSIEGKDHYFYYPSSAEVAGEKIRFFDDSGCMSLSFGDFEKNRELMMVDEVEDLRLENAESGDANFESWYLDGDLVLYAKSFQNKKFGVWAFADFKDVLACASSVDNVFASVTDKLAYVNDKYSFSMNLPDDFRVQYLENGVILKKTILAGEDSYDVEIVVMPFENLSEYTALTDYIAFKYADYNVIPVSYANGEGYYVDEGLGHDAVRHFFTANEGATIIYEIYLKVPSVRFATHLEGFEAIIKGLRIF